jgi:hypothetical protein
MIAMSFVNRIYHHQKLASGGKGTARLSNWSKTMKRSEVAEGFNRAISRKLAA